MTNGRLAAGLLYISGVGLSICLAWGQWQEGALWLAVTAGAAVMLNRELR